MKWLRGILATLALMAAFVAGRYSMRPADAPVEQARADDNKVEQKKPADAIKGWQKGKGWGWVWGKDDEVGSLNEMTPASVKAALALVKEGVPWGIYGQSSTFLIYPNPFGDKIDPATFDPSKMPFAKRSTIMFWTVSLPRKWSIR